MDERADNTPIQADRIIEICQKTLDQYTDKRVVAAYIYGSILTGRFRPDSDIDVAILDTHDDPLDLNAQSDLMNRLECATSIGVDLRMLREGTPSYQLNILENGRLICLRNTKEASEFEHNARDKHRQQQEKHDREWSSMISTLANRDTNKP